MSIVRLSDRNPSSWTLRRVVERGALAVECQRCKRLAELDLLDLVGRFGPEATVEIVRQRLVCHLCGSRDVRALVRLAGIRGDKAWLPAPPRARR